MVSAATTPQPTIACTLSAGDYRERLKEIRGIARDALKSYDKKGLVLTLRYDASAADRVIKMVRREQECCAFLNFAVREDTRQIVVSVSAPAEARLAAETMFEQSSRPTAIVATPPRGRTGALCILADIRRN